MIQALKLHSRFLVKSLGALTSNKMSVVLDKDIRPWKSLGNYEETYNH
jgi:hypothetical protein